MAIALVAHTAAGSANGNSVTTAGIDTTGANLIALYLSEGPGTTPATPTDSNGNVWSKVRTDNTGGSVEGSLFVCQPTIVGPGHTFSYLHSGFFPGIAVAAFSGTSASPADGNIGTIGSAVTSLQPGSLTPSASGDLFVSGLAYGASRTIGITGTGWAITDTVDFLAAGNNQGVSLAYLISTGSSAQNPTWTISSALSPATAQAAYLAAAGGGATPLPFFTTMGATRLRR